jgi:hypothetical protein
MFTHLKWRKRLKKKILPLVSNKKEVGGRGKNCLPTTKEKEIARKKKMKTICSPILKERVGETKKKNIVHPFQKKEIRRGKNCLFVTNSDFLLQSL